MQGKYHVITLCGSTRFKPEFEKMQKELTLAGNIVISVGLFGHSGDEEVWENKKDGDVTETKWMLDDMHKRKIDMADAIYVINPDGYIGDSTWSEICYAKMIGKEIVSINPIDEYEIDEKIAKHKVIAERLAWQQIDGIRHSDGYYCLADYVSFKYKRKDVVDPWISLETHYDGTPWIDHEDSEQRVDPFEYYGTQKVANFIEEIIMRRGDYYDNK